MGQGTKIGTGIGIRTGFPTESETKIHRTS